MDLIAAKTLKKQLEQASRSDDLPCPPAERRRTNRLRHRIRLPPNDQHQHLTEVCLLTPDFSSFPSARCEAGQIVPHRLAMREEREQHISPMHGWMFTMHPSIIQVPVES